MKYLWGSRLFAAALVLGGAGGVLLSGVAIAMLAAHGTGALVGPAFSMLLYGTALVAGVGLWRQRRYGMVWAPVLFALQVPVLSLPRLSYEWFTGASVAYKVGAGMHQWAVQVGASDHFSMAFDATAASYGVNLFALAAAVYLVALRSRGASAPARPGDAG